MRNVIQPADAAAREGLAVAGHALLDPSKPGVPGLEGPDTPGGRLPGIRSQHPLAAIMPVVLRF